MIILNLVDEWDDTLGGHGRDDRRIQTETPMAMAQTQGKHRRMGGLGTKRGGRRVTTNDEDVKTQRRVQVEQNIRHNKSLATVATTIRTNPGC